MLERAMALIRRMNEEEAQAFAFCLCSLVEPTLLEEVMGMQEFILDNEYGKTMQDALGDCESKDEAQQKIVELIKRMMFEYEHN